MLKLQRIRQGPSSRDDDTTDLAPDRLENHALRPKSYQRLSSTLEFLSPKVHARTCRSSGDTPSLCTHFKSISSKLNYGPDTRNFRTLEEPADSRNAQLKDSIAAVNQGGDQALALLSQSWPPYRRYKVPATISQGPSHTKLSSCQVPSYQQSLRLTQLLSYLPSVNATSSLTTWGTRDCPTASTEPGMLGHDHTKAYKFPTQKSLLDRELGGLLFTP
ncbi:unnamed protein product [Prunus armeniaca]